jgi:TldD protein
MRPVPERSLAADRGLRRLRRYVPGEPVAGSASAWRGMCLQTRTGQGSDHVFADGADLLADLPGASRAAVEAARQVLSENLAGEPGQGRDDADDDAWAAQVAERYQVHLVRADYRQRVAVGTLVKLGIDERAATSVEILDAADAAGTDVVQWHPDDPATARRLVEEAAEAVRRTVELPSAPLPATRCDLVLDPGWAGPLFHELVGHPLEGDVVASGTSYLAGLRGEHVAPAWLSVTDGCAPPGEGLTARLDDEGTPVAATALIDRGRVAGPLSDRLTGAAGGTARSGTTRGSTGYGCTGHGRRLDYRHCVVPRMWHTRACVGAAPQEPTGPARLHPRGLQLAWMNLFTGDVEFRSPAGLLDTGAGMHRTGAFTVAGNARRILAELRPGPGAVRGGGRARRGCGKLGQFPLISTFANGGLWIPGEAVHVRADQGR